MKIYSQSPLRISLYGGGTDLMPFSDDFGGVCINMAINLYQKLTLYTGDDLYGRETKLAQNSDPSLCYEILKAFGLGSMHHAVVESECDGLIKAGLGSSASFAVALIAALRKNKNVDFIPANIAEEAWRAEVNGLGWYGGKQDQIVAAHGGLNFIEIGPGQAIDIMQYDKELAFELLPYLHLYYIGGQRSSHLIQNGFKSLSDEQEDVLKEIKRIAELAGKALAKGQLEKLAELLDMSWRLKKRSNIGVTNEKIDGIYKYATSNGASSGKLCGAGGGGHMLFFAPILKSEQLDLAMSKKGYEKIDFMPDFTGVTTRIL